MASTKLYSGREEYLSSQTYLLGSENGEFGTEIISKLVICMPLPLFFILKTPQGIAFQRVSMITILLANCPINVHRHSKGAMVAYAT